MEKAETTDEQATYTLFNITTNTCKPLQVTLKVNDADLTVEVDTGVSMSLISNVTFQKLWPAQSSPALLPTKTKLHAHIQDSRLMYWGRSQQGCNLSHNKKPYSFW